MFTLILILFDIEIRLLDMISRRKDLLTCTDLQLYFQRKGFFIQEPLLHKHQGKLL